MNKKINPVVSVIILLVVIGIALGVMFHFADQKEPPLPTSMGAAMQASGGGAPNAPSGQRGRQSGSPGPSATAGGDRTNR